MAKRKSKLGKQLQNIADNWVLLHACHTTIWRENEEKGDKSVMGFYYAQGKEVKFTQRKRKGKKDGRQNNLV
jgi:hypothetical protein